MKNIHRILDSLFSFHIALNINWLGGNNKISIAKTKVLRVVYGWY